ncbi:NADP-dependent isocitrate dehydrogenase, partial [Streptomyces achromogenes]
AGLAKAFAPLAETLAANERKIVDELNAVQGRPAEIGGYYQVDKAKADAVMRPSATWNEVLASLS